MGSFWKPWDLGFLIQTFAFLQSGSFPFRTCVRDPHFRKTCICIEIKSIIVLKDFSVSCVSFKEMFSVHYGKYLNLTYPEWNRQVWKFNILWASSKPKLSALLNARHREICLRYLLRGLTSISLQKRYFVLDSSKWTKLVTQPLYLK